MDLVQLLFTRLATFSEDPQDSDDASSIDQVLCSSTSKKKIVKGLVTTYSDILGHFVSIVIIIYLFISRSGRSKVI